MLNNITPTRTGHVIPENDEGRCGGGLLDAIQNEHRNSAAFTHAEQGITEAHKHFAHLQASLALAGGFTLHELAHGGYLVSRWNCTRALPDLHAVAVFLRQVSGRPS